MNLRERIADWISGGALTRAKADNAMWFEASAQLGAKFLLAGEAHEVELHQCQDLWFDACTDVDGLTEALRSIIAQEKPTSNATVRRMARIAREALE